MKTFRLPDLGEGLTEAEIVAWHVAPGDHVVTDQPLVAVETEKAVVEVPAPWPGTVAAIHGEPGEIVPVGAALVDFAEQSVDSGTVVGDLVTADQTVEGPAKQGRGDETQAVRRRVVPAARRRAGELGLDLVGMVGSGPGGAITLADVEKAAKARGTAAPAVGEPLRGPRRAMAEAMSRAGQAVVRATVTEEADVTAWAGPAADPTVRLIRAVVAGSRSEPALNAWYDAAGGVRTLHDMVDLGLAVDTADGLFVPVIRDAGSMDASSLRAKVNDLRDAVAKRSLAAGDMRGATITLSNFGAIGGLHSELAVVPPQVAILGAGRMFERPAYVGDDLKRRVVMPLSLSVDHRVVTGGEAIRFLLAVRADLERSS